MDSSRVVARGQAGGSVGPAARVGGGSGSGVGQRQAAALRHTGDLKAILMSPQLHRNWQSSARRTLFCACEAEGPQPAPFRCRYPHTRCHTAEEHPLLMDGGRSNEAVPNGAGQGSEVSTWAVLGTIILLELFLAIATLHQIVDLKGPASRQARPLSNERAKRPGAATGRRAGWQH